MSEREREAGTAGAASLGIMLKKILLTLGLAKAPAPVKTYFAVSSLFGAVPALAYVGWKNRDRIRSVFQRATHAEAPRLASAPAAT